MAAPEIITAVTTPFADNGDLLLDGFVEQLNYLVKQVDGVFVAGTTGEFPCLTLEEVTALTAATLDVFGPARTVVHVGAPSIGQALALAAAALALGAHRFAAITPYYLAASVTGCARYYRALRQRLGEAELYGYLFPDIAGTDIQPVDLPELLDAGISGLKVSGRAATRVRAYLDVAPPDFPVWSGNDADLPAVLAAGGRGTVSGVSGVIPQCWADYTAAVNSGDQVAQHQAQQRIQAVVPVLGPSIANLKCGLDITGRVGGHCRMVIDPPDRHTQERIASTLAEVGALGSGATEQLTSSKGDVT